MGTTVTPNLGLIKPDSVEPAANWPAQVGANMDILDGVVINPNPSMRPLFNQDTVDNTVVATTYAVETNPAQLVFTAPPSGVVSIEVVAEIDIECGAVTNIVGVITVSYQVLTGNTIGSGTEVLAPSSDRAALVRARGAAAGSFGGAATATNNYLLTGLTPGNDFNIRTFHQVAVSGGTVPDLSTKRVGKRSLFVRPEL